MKIHSAALLRLSLPLALLISANLAAAFILKNAQSPSHANENLPSSVIGVHHLGSEYFIDEFYVDKSIRDNIGEEGGGGSMMCCVMLPRKWKPTLTVDVRWEVDHILRSVDPKVPETAEVVGIYRAKVPVEEYVQPGDFYVHFFADGRARIVVSRFTSYGEKHPIRLNDPNAGRAATQGKRVEALFTAEELAENQRQIQLDRKKYGDWR